MKSDLNPKEQKYLNQIMDILKASGVNPSYREDAKIQLIEHINEARIRNEDFQDDLGTPENFALHFMDTAVTKEDSIAQRIDHTESTHQNKRYFLLRVLLHLFFFRAYIMLACNFLLFCFLHQYSLQAMNLISIYLIFLITFGGICCSFLLMLL